MRSLTRARLLKAAGILVCLVPLGLMVFAALTGRLEAEPIKDLEHRTGTWGITFLTATLAVTPLRRLTGWNRLQSYRRMLGLFAFFYLGLHFLVYLVLDQFFDWHTIVKDIAKRPYITVGFTGLVLLVPLAVTSTRGWVRRLGGGGCPCTPSSTPRPWPASSISRGRRRRTSRAPRATRW